MAATIKLEDICLGQQNCKILGRLTRLWDSKNMNRRAADPFISIDGIIVDEDGKMAQINVPKKLEKQFRPLLNTGSVYIFANVTAVDAKKKTYIYHHQKYILQLQSNTKVHRLESRGGNIPLFAFNFCPFDQLPSKDIVSKPLQDLIGVISNVGPYDFASATSQKKIRKIQIRDQEEQTQELLLWGEYGEKFEEDSVFEKSQQGTVVAIFAGITVGSFSGKIQASSSSATQVYIDLDIPEVNKFRDSYQWETPTLHRHLPQMLQSSPIEAAGKLYKIDEICILPDSSFQGGASYSCIAKITAVITSTKWYYKACRRCKKGYSSSLEEPRCDCPVSNPVAMYKLPLTITDDTGSIDAIAFSSIAEDLVERTAFEASQNMKIDAADQAVSLETAIGKTRLFYIGMSPDSSSNFSIKYVLRKSFPVDNKKESLMPPSTELPSTPVNSILTLPDSTNLSSSSSTAKRPLHFQNDMHNTNLSSPQHASASANMPKRHKPIPADNDTQDDDMPQSNKET